MRRKISVAFFVGQPSYHRNDEVAFTGSSPLGLQLVADRQRPDAPAGRGKDGVGQCRCEGRHAGLADVAWRRVAAGRHDVDIGHQRRLIDQVSFGALCDLIAALRR
jgi:hypothetical protein